MIKNNNLIFLSENIYNFGKIKEIFAKDLFFNRSNSGDYHYQPGLLIALLSRAELLHLK